MLWLALFCAFLVSSCTSRDSERAGVEAGNTKVAGLLLDSAGIPLSMVPVALSRSTAEIVAQDTTDPVGHFEFLVPQGVYQLIAFDSSGWHSLQTVDITSDDDLLIGDVQWNESPALSSTAMSSSFISSSSIATGLSSSVMTMVDPRDGQSYTTATIGGLTWMTQNLNYSGDDGQGGRAFSLGWCYGQDTTVHTDNDSCVTNGRFYNWAQVMTIDTVYINSFLNGTDVGVQGICPSGWHLPSEAEWLALQDSLGGMLVAAAAMRVGGSSGFNALLSGYLLGTAWFQANEIAMFWSAKESATQTYAKSFNVGVDVDYLIENDTYKFQGLSVRCVYSRIESDH